MVATAQPFTTGDIAFIGKRDIVTDWATRVVANGGAMPSQTSIIAMENLRVGCISAGLTSKIYSLCVFVPDSLIASFTPLFLHKGYTLWTNSNFVSGDLNINGLKGDGTTKSVDTGCMAKALASGGVSDTSDGSRGLSVIITESSTNRAEGTIGYQDADNTKTLALNVSDGGATLWVPWTLSATVLLQTNDYGRVGYVSANVWNDSNTNISVFVASPLEAHKILTNKVNLGVAQDVTATDNTISVFATKHGSTNFAWSVTRMSLAMVHDGFTQTESSNFWVLARTCRETLGGGTGDPIHEYNTKVVAAGGAAISTTTSNALRTFVGGLDTDGTLYSMIAVNPYLPDNFTAARTPVVWQWGAQHWTNNNFAASNLSVDGLRGDGTSKYWGTAIQPSTTLNRGFTHASAGMSMIVVSNNATGKYVAGVGSGAANSHFAILNENGVNQIYCWRFDSVNSNFLLATGLTNGFTSGSRTASNAIALYRARSDTTFARLTNGTGTMGGSAIAAPLAAFALNGNGTVSAYSPQQVSFFAVHAGLTEAQTSNFWLRAQALRTALGGGAP